MSNIALHARTSDKFALSPQHRYRLRDMRRKRQGMHAHADFRVTPRWRQTTVWFALLCFFCVRPALAQHEHSSSEFEVFVAAEGLAGHGQPHPREDDPWVDADVIFGLSHDQFRVFGEYYITS